MGVRQTGNASGKWEIRIVRVETKLDDLAKFAAALKLAKDYPKDQGWEVDLDHAEVTELTEEGRRDSSQNAV